MERAIELLRMILAEMKVQTAILQSFANAPKPDPKQTMEEAMKLVNAAGFGDLVSKMSQGSQR